VTFSTTTPPGTARTRENSLLPWNLVTFGRTVEQPPGDPLDDRPSERRPRS
jgi:hypothetical protein